ncbi:MAG: histidine kinase [Gallionella sp.]|nr:histidine kinase [Gallionella sp.]MDD4945697.1 histidine kinase [Gallionella sp.]
MTVTAYVLHIEPTANCPGEVLDQLTPQLATMVHRSVGNQQTLDAALKLREWDAILCSSNELTDANTPHAFLDSLPGMACQLHLDTDDKLNFLYASEGCTDLLGITPPELEQNAQFLLGKLHPDDAEAFFLGMRQSAKDGTAWNWEGRIQLPEHQEIKWLNLRAKDPHSNPQGTYWNGFMINITQNRKASLEIKRSRQRLRELSSHIENIKEEERIRIAREIHDEIGVLLTALKMDLSWLRNRLPEDNTALMEKARDMADLLDTAGKSVNNLVHSLRPAFLDCFGIVAAIEIEAREFTKRTGIPCKIKKSSDNIVISDEQSITLFRVFQEAMNNIMKHADAHKVQVQISEGPHGIELIVSDDGKGFDESARNKPRSFGLRGIQERIGHLGGRVRISSAAGTGTIVAVLLPTIE